jgi:hypothetical protein
VDVNLYVRGTRAEVEGALAALKRELADFEAEVWRDYRLSDLEPDARWEGPITVEIHHKLVTRREDAIAFVGSAVKRVDPGFVTIVGGDVFLRPIDE